NGLPSYSIDWFRGSTLFASGDVFNVCHSSAAVYVAIATYYSCFLSAIVVKDTVHIVPGGASFDVTGIQSGDVSCAGGNNGYAQALLTGGTPPFQYTWNPAIGTTATITNLTAGGYAVTVTDSIGCIDTASVSIIEPSQITATAAGDTTICIGQSTTISATATGGSGNYNFAWSNGVNTSSQLVSPASTTVYSVVITDDSGCTVPLLPVTVTVN